MSRPVISSDLHLGHANIIKFRTMFETAKEHDDFVIQRHKETVGKNDTWICLGDVAFTRESLYRLREIQCRRKILVMGNHDLERGGLTMLDLLNVFDEVVALKKHKAFGVSMWLSHCPIHPEELRGSAVNIHGHMHYNQLKDNRFINICLEHTHFGAVPLEDLLGYWKEGCKNAKFLEKHTKKKAIKEPLQLPPEALELLSTINMYVTKARFNNVVSKMLPEEVVFKNFNNLLAQYVGDIFDEVFREGVTLSQDQIELIRKPLNITSAAIVREGIKEFQ